MSEKKFDKNKSAGITLIALVVTIIVLLILSGISISMISRDSSILKKATKANNINKYTQVEEQVKLAYMAVKIEVETKVNETEFYDATTEENTMKLGKIVERNLVEKEWSVNYSKAGRINIIYKNDIIDEDLKDIGKEIRDGKIEYEIILEPQLVRLATDLIEIDYGEKTKTTAIQGDTIRIEEEEFIILSNENGKILAMPYHNITLSMTDPKQSTKSDNLAFSEIQFWKKGTKNIEPIEKSNIYKYVNAYKIKLQSLVGGCITAKVPRAYGDEIDNISSFKGIKNNEDKALLTIDGRLYWIGSTQAPWYDAGVMVMWSNGSFNYRTWSLKSQEGVRPLIIIDVS